MKKLLSIVLAMMMVFAMGTTAFAAETTDITIQDNTAVPAETTRTYNGYQLLNLTTSLKTDVDHSAADHVHNDACYNYSYTVNTKYTSVLQNEVFANATAEFWGENTPAAASDITDAQILDYFAAQTSDSNDTYGSLRLVADRLYRAIKTAGNITADATAQGNTLTAGQGYWLIADVTDLSASTDEANSLVMIDTKGQETITVTTKTSIPTVDKKVKDIDDSNDNNIADNDWNDIADHDIGDTVPFQLTATLPNNLDYYQTYQMIFHDTLSDGLTLDADSFVVYVVTGSTTTQVANGYTVNNPGTDNCSFDIAITDVNALTDANNNDIIVTKDSTIVVEYTAVLNDNAVLGGVGNPNEVHLEFSNDPYSDQTGKTNPDEVKVFTYKVVINKVDSSDNALEGAGFTLYKKNAADEYIAIGGELLNDSDNNPLTTFAWTGLDSGDYKLVETTVPSGYNKMDDLEFTIAGTAGTDTETGETILTQLSGGALGEGDVSTGTITEDIVNNSGTVLPETGAMGTMIFIGVGSTAILIAVVFMVTRKKMSIYAD